MERFKTLMLREWMQHRFGWIVIVAVPLLIALGLSLFGQAKVELDDVKEVPMALAVAVIVIAFVTATTLGLAWSAVLLQSPGLARRDTQDRSIEFWLSLPTGHVQSVAAPLLVHLILVPLGAFACGVIGGLVLSLPIVATTTGIASWFALPWGGLLAAIVSLALRLALGIVLVTLWYSPLILGTMAASAWLKRWGVPAVVGVVGIGGLVLDKVYGNRIVWDALRALAVNARHAFIATGQDPNPGRWTIQSPDDVGAVLAAVPRAVLGDAGDALLQLASPAFLVALAIAAVAFALLVLRRQRGA